MKTKLQRSYLLALVALMGTGLAQAGPGDPGHYRDRYLDHKGDRIERHLDRKGEHVDQWLDHRGDAVDVRLDRAADYAAVQGRDTLAARLDHRGDRIRDHGGMR